MSLSNIVSDKELWYYIYNIHSGQWFVADEIYTDELKYAQIFNLYEALSIVKEKNIGVLNEVMVPVVCTRNWIKE